MIVLVILVTLAIVVAVLARAFVAAGGETADAGSGESGEAKVAKYRQLRDLELDWRTGKLSPDDYQRSRRQLREEAAALLTRTTGPDEVAPSGNGRAARPS